MGLQFGFGELNAATIDPDLLPADIPNGAGKFDPDNDKIWQWSGGVDLNNDDEIVELEYDLAEPLNIIGLWTKTIVCWRKNYANKQLLIKSQSVENV